MGWLSSIFPSLGSSTDAFTGDAVREQLAAFRTFLNGGTNPVVRFWVEAGTSYGHQSSTANLIYRLARAPGTDDLNFGYTGTIEIYYENADELGKLRQLIPELNNDPAEIGHALLVPIRYKGRPTDRVNLGFTGGANAVNDYVDSLNVEFFLRLQPYNWAGPEQIQRRGQTTIDLTTVPQLGDGFNSRLFYVDPSLYSDPPWEAFAEDAIVNVLRVLYSDATLSDFRVLTAYSIKGLLCRFNTNPVFGAALVCASVMQWQKRGGSTYRRAKPVIIVNFDDFGTTTESLGNDLKDVLKGNVGSTENGLRVSLDSTTARNETLTLNYERRRAFFAGLGSEGRFSYLNYPDSVEAVNNALGGLRGRNDQVLFIQLGRIPPAFFSYAVFRSTLPALFEGQNTANLAVNIGRPYMQIPASDLPVSSRLKMYPSVTLQGLNPDVVPTTLLTVATQLSSPNTTWPESPSDAPPSIIGDYYRQFTDEAERPTDVITNYFKEVKSFFAKPAKDKFGLAVAYLNSVRPTTSLVAAGPPDNPLGALYEKLKQSVTVGKPLDLVPGILTEGLIPAFIQSFLREYAPGLTLTVSAFTHDGDPPNVTKITVAGPTEAFASIGVSCGVRVVLTAPNGTLTSEVTFANKETWTLADVPWIVLKDPYVRLLLSDSNLPVAATFGGIYPALESANPPTTAIVEIGVGKQDQWPAAIRFAQNYPSIASAFQMATSINLVQSLPAPFNVLTDLGVTEVQLQYDYAKSTLHSILITAQSNSQKLPLIGTLTLSNVKVSTVVLDPANTRRLVVGASAEFGMGAPDPAIIGVSVSYPGLTILGELRQGVITIEKIFSTFLPDYQLSLPEVPKIDQFRFNYNHTTDYLVVTLNLNIQWTFAFFGKDLFEIDTVGFEVTRITGVNRGSVTGNTVLLPNSAKIGVTIGASYLGDNKWRFTALQTSGVVDLNDLLTEYLGEAWVPPVTFPRLDGLSLTLDWKDASSTAFEFTAKTATKWTPIPVLPEVTATGRAKIGYRPEGPAAEGVPTEDVPGTYGEVSAEITLWNIDLKAVYNFNPKSQKLCVEWLALTACLEQQGEDTVAVFSLNGKSIGEMVEMFVSWATGAKYGLAAPWNLLNDIKLNGFKVEYNFSKKTVAFRVDIGPMSFGLFTIKGISLSYDPKQPDSKVSITIEGSFTWEPGKGSLGWDPTKPETTPAPPGGGNKYLDLRLLALGQHVTVSGLTEKRQVQDVIALLRALKVPKPPEIPVGRTGQPVPAPLNSWFVAFDFGVLKVEEKKGPEPSESLMAVGDRLPAVSAADAKPTYFLQLSVVFNDPILYALQIALDGPMAKVFAGLNFQIMYRQVSETVGCYSAQIALPNVMRKFQVGVATVTLPVFGIDVYTNGDFQVDIGFPWKMDFSRSFTIEAIVYPGIPVLGSAGFYVGKLSSATSDKVPATDKGWFNPVLVFGFGAQLGLGKSVEAGILRAGFSLTVFGVIEGVLARWLPYVGPTPGGGLSQLADGYYFALTGTVGVQGRLYGTVDFAVVKADVDVAISIYIRFTLVAYEDVTIEAVASVRVKVSIKIDLGLFSITISFSFSATVEATFVLPSPIGHDAPWALKGVAPPAARSLQQRKVSRLRAAGRSVLAAGTGYDPNWGNLLQGRRIELQGWVAPVLTVAGDEATTPSQQRICYVVNFFLPVPRPVQTPNPRSASLHNAVAHTVEAASVAHVALARAREEATTFTFEDLAVRVLQWVIAAGLPTPMSPDTVDGQVVTSEFLSAALDYLSGATTPIPVPADAIEHFLDDQTHFLFASTPQQDSNGAFFPAPPGTTLNVPSYPPETSASPAYNYAFGDYNSTSSAYLGFLNDYFNDLRVQVRAEQPKPSLPGADAGAAGPSIASYIFSDYFALIGRQGVQSLLDALKNFKMVIDPSKTVEATVKWVNDTGRISDPRDQFTPAELFQANRDHVLSTAASGPLTIRAMTWQTAGGKSFQAISGEPVFQKGFNGRQLATQNAGDTRILQANVEVRYQSQRYLTVSGDSLDSIAAHFQVSIDHLLDHTDIVTNAALLAPMAIVTAPDFSYRIAAGDTLSSVGGRFGVSLDALADANGAVAGLFDVTTDPNLNVPELVQFRLGDLIDEARRTLALQDLAAMASRFYLHGLRLPTEGLTANAAGLFVTGGPGSYKYPLDLGQFALTGQAFPLPDIPSLNAPKFRFTLTRGAAEQWMDLGAAGSATVTFTLDSDRDFARYKSVKDFALASRLRTGMSAIIPLRAGETQPARFPLSQQVYWQSAAAVTLPHQTLSPPMPQPCIWLLPDSLVNLANAAVPLPRVKPVIARSDSATGSTVEQPVANYGLGTLVTFSVRRTEPVEGAPTTDRLYEIIGATERDTVLLQRLLDQVRSDDGAFDQMILLYRPASTGSEVTGWQSDDPAATLMGVAQVNLSTETRPPGAMVTPEAAARPAAGVSNVINGPTAFLRLLWEASITRQGGFYLSYSTGIGSGDVRGLPERIFGDSSAAEIAVLALFRAGDPGSQAIANYMNVAATNQPLDLNDAALIAEAVPVETDTRPVTATDTLAGLAAEYYTDESVLAALNGLARLAGTVTVPGGRYEVGAPGSSPGGNLLDIARHFNTTVQALRDANPHRTDWPDPLPQYAALALPAISVRIGADPGGSTFATLSEYYGAPAAGIAAANSAAVGLFATGQSLKVLIGPLALAPLVPPGVTGFHCSRTAPPVLSPPAVVPSGPEWGSIYLLHLFSLLGFRVADNPDFRQSPWGLPAGPADPNGDPPADKIQAPEASAEGDDWQFTRTLPYPKFYKHPPARVPAVLPTPTNSPYLGVGGLIQFELAWQDVFGNRILSELSEPQTSADRPPNHAPQITGYTDRLLGIGQWPAVANTFSVMPDQHGDPELTVSLVFDTSQYQVPDAGPRVSHAMAIYEQILHQLRDPNGVDVALTTTVVPTESSLLSPAEQQRLVHWVESIYIWLRSLIAPPAPPPPDFDPDLTVSVPLDLSKVCRDQIFPVRATVTIRRNPHLVEGDLSMAAGVVAASTTLVPWTGPLSSGETSTQHSQLLMAAAGAGPGPDPAATQRDITAFAKAFTSAFAKIPDVTFHIATGSDRNAFTSGDRAELWAVQLGIAAASTAISYWITNRSNPKQFAPRPISNKLTSRPQTPIIPYQTGTVISLSSPSTEKSFLSIDLDQWMRFTLTEVDALLTSRYVAPALILRSKAPGPDALQLLLDAKKALADALKQAMVPVFAGETATEPERTAIQEAFYQSLLSVLSQFYGVKVGLQFSADVHAAVARRPGDSDPPRLYGDIATRELLPVEAAASQVGRNLSLSSPKLNLKFAGADDAPHYLSFLLSSTSSEASIPLNLSYSCQYIEHEISKLRGIEGYQPSAWLSFADNASAPDWPLNTELGEFTVPIVLRAFPDTPTLLRQDRLDVIESPCYRPSEALASSTPLDFGVSTCAKPGTYNPLAGATQWNYRFEYAQQVHYLQDAIHGLVQFNLTVPSSLAAMALERDLFDNLAEFTQVYPQVLADLDKYLVPLEVGTTSPDQIKNAQAALESAAILVQWVADAAQGIGSNLHVREELAATAGASYPFSITEEAVEKQDPDGSSVEALSVVVRLPAPPPPRVGTPLVEIDPSTYACQPNGGDDRTFAFVYKNKETGRYLTTEAGRTIAARSFVLPGLDILERQDSQVSVYLTRNEELANRAIAEMFVYTTPKVSFPEPLLPTLTRDQPVNLATIHAVGVDSPVTRSLSCQLAGLYEVLFENAGTDSVTLTMTVYYEYSVSTDIPKIRLPVYLMPPTLVAVRPGGAGEPIVDVIEDQVRGWEDWFLPTDPQTTDGALLFDLTIMSNVTQRPMPILHLPGLYLPLVSLSPVVRETCGVPSLDA